MSAFIDSLARPDLRDLVAYTSARSLTSSRDARVFLDANESPYQRADASGLNRYPEPQPRDLRRTLARLYGVSEEALLMCRGADEAIDLLVRAFCRPGLDEVIVCPPTYGMYELSARIQGAGIVRIPQRGGGGTYNVLRPDLERVVEACRAPTARVKVVFLCSPNNPTGGALELAAVEQLCQALDQHALLVLDEAYVEFAREGSAAALVARYPGLVILRTLSKAWGLAGARFGTLIADPAVLALLEKIRPPYPLSEPTIRAVRDALTPSGVAWVDGQVRALLERREDLALSLASLPIVEQVHPSDANFLLVRTTDVAVFLARCAAAGVVVRDRSGEPQLERCVRISIGTEEQNEHLLRALASEVAAS